MSEFFQQDRGARSADEWQRREEDRERRDHGQKRQQAELFLDTPEDREYASHYSYQSLVCVGCQHVLAGHDFPLGKCMEPGCQCPGFEQVAD